MCNVEIESSLARIAGRSNVSTSEHVLQRYMKDRSHLTGSMPIAVVKPSNTRQVSKIMKLCTNSRMKVVVRGGGTSLTGASEPLGKCIVIDMSSFDKILKIHVQDGYAVVEPGVFVQTLNDKLSERGYFYPPDPGSSSIATIGGTINTNAGGLRAIHYGTTKDWLLGLELVLPNGEVLNTGNIVSKRSIGYDITGLICASEGTLGIVTKAILRIEPKPEKIGKAIAFYNAIEDAADTITSMKKDCILPLGAEFLDGKSIRMIENSKQLKIPKNANYMLIVDVEGNKEAMPRLLKQVEKHLSKNASFVEATSSPREMEKLQQARKNLFLETHKLAERARKSVIIEDIVVPSSELAATQREMERMLAKQSLEVILFGHIGDGNLHANIIADFEKEKREVDALQEAMGKIAIKHGGSVSGEHGIGIAKKRMLLDEFKSRRSQGLIPLMKRIKKAFDPHGIMNNGKIFD